MEHVGLDVHKNQSQICILTRDGERRVADLGGGPGHYAREFAGRHESIEVWLIDMPRTIETAREPGRCAARDASVQTVAWSFYDEPIPAGLPSFDLVFVSQVVHAESPERDRGLLTLRRAKGPLQQEP